MLLKFPDLNAKNLIKYMQMILIFPENTKIRKIFDKKKS